MNLDPRLSLPLLAVSAALAGPVTTVPWNGSTGAVSFTYDDARPGQIPNLIPQLDALGIKATFFIAVSNTGGDFETKKSSWIAASKNGQELANHTKTHVSPTDANVKEMATYLRALDPTVESVTFAYPNCTVTGTSGVNAENFIARGCGSTRYAWGSQPSDWMNIQGLIVTSSAANSAVTAVNSAKSENTWATIIIHDVTASPDQYSLTPANNKSILDAAVAAKVWIAPYATVAAYWRAHFTMDAVTATKSGSNWNMSWTAPHAKMPKSVKLRVKLATATFGNDFVVKQGDSTIAPQADGSYVIEFMKLSMSVLPKATGVAPRAHEVLPQIQARPAPGGIVLENLDRGVDAVVTDARGAILFSGTVADRLIPLDRSNRSGILFVTISDRASGISVRRMVNSVR